MNTQTLPDKELMRRKSKSVSAPPVKDSRIWINGGSFQNLLDRSLRALAHRLKRGVCNTSSHFDCTMKIQIEAKGCKALLTEFLSKVLALTHAQHTIFCSIYIEELTENKIVAQLYGNWFDTFDHDIRSIVASRTTLKRSEDGSYDCSISYKS